MGEIFFIVKTLVVTVLVILLMQIRIGPKTIEQRSLAWMHESSAIEALRGVADGAVTASEHGYVWVKKAIDRQFGGGGNHRSRNGGDVHVGERRAKHQTNWDDEVKRTDEDAAD